MPSLSVAVTAAARHYALYCQLTGYDTVVPDPAVPGLIVVPVSCRYARDRGVSEDDVWRWELWLLLAQLEDRVDQALLRQLVDGGHERSIAIATARGRSTRGDAFGLLNCKARLLGVDSLGARFTAGGVNRLGAVLAMEVTLPAWPDDQQAPDLTIP